MQLSERNINNLQYKVSKLINSPTSSLHNLEFIVGAMNFATNYTLKGKILIHPVVRLMNFIYRFPNRDRMRKTPKILIKHLKPWLKEDIYSPIPLVFPLSQISIHVDASDQGWGATFATEKETFYKYRKW